MQVGAQLLLLERFDFINMDLHIHCNPCQWQDPILSKLPEIHVGVPQQGGKFAKFTSKKRTGWGIHVSLTWHCTDGLISDHVHV